MSCVANGKQHIQISSFGRADQKMTTAIFEPSPLEQLNWLIHLQYVRREIDNCKELIKRQIKKSNGKHEYAFFNQGVILREEGKIQEALESFQICHKLNCGSTDNIKEVAKCLFLLRKYRIALEAYLEAERISTKPDWEIYHNIGQCWVSLGENAKAKEYTKKAVQLGKQECSYTLLIKILISEEDLQAAIDVSNAALESCPDSTAMLTESGLLHLKMGQIQPAFQCLSSAVALNPNCSEALLGIGCITQAHEDYEVALSKYKIAVQINPESIALWNNIGMCFFAKQKFVAAISCLKRALWISPLNWKVLLNLGLVHLSTSQPASAFNFLCAAVNLRPDVALIFLALGCALFELKDPENAVKAFQQADTLSQDNYNIMLNTVLALTTIGQNEQAVKILEKFKNISAEENQMDKQVIDLASKLESKLKKLMVRDEMEELSNSLIEHNLDNNSQETKPNTGDDNRNSNEENFRKLQSDEV